MSKAIVSTDLFADYSSPTFVRWHYKTENTPYKAGLTYGQEGFALVFGSVSGWHTVISWLKGGRNMWAHYVSEGTDYGWSEYAQKSDLDLKLNNTSIFVGNGGDFGQAIKKAGIVQLNRVGFFICNNPSNSPLENGLIILAHNVGYWNNHPMYIQINGSSISCGTLNCSDYTHITKD